MRKCTLQIVTCLIALCILTGCTDHTIEEKSVQIEKEWEISTYPAEKPEGEVYHWVLLQNDRNSVDEEIMIRVNERLAELGMEERLQMHVVTVENLVTNETIDGVKETLRGQMDFVSISPSLIAFSKDDWGKVYLDIADELKAGGLQEFYQRVPEKVWEVNRIAGGQYSFSSGKTTYTMGYAFSPAAVEVMGAENLVALQEAEGFEKEEVWKTLYEKTKTPVLWYGSNGQSVLSRARKEEPYKQNRFSVLAGYWDLHYLGKLTEDIRFNYELKKFEWIGESETYEGLLKTLFSYYEKGYLTENETMDDEGMDMEGTVLKGTDAALQKGNSERPAMWVPLFQKPQIINKENDEYYYSGVHVEAKEGWQGVLNRIGADEELSLLLNRGIEGRDYELEKKYGVNCVNDPKIRNYSMLMSDVLYYETTSRMYYDCPLDVQTENRYEYIEGLYEKAKENTMGDFVFNPAPLEEELTVCNQTSYLYKGASFYDELEGKTPEGLTYPLFKRKFNKDKFNDFWDSYRTAMKEKEIEKVVAEINRQYQEWMEGV